MRALWLSLLVVTTVAGCARVSESRFNPFNWFGRSEERVATTRVEVIQDPRPLVAEVSSLSVDQVPGGAILRAVGLPPTQGFHTGALVRQPDVAGRISYTFRIVPPVEDTRVSTEPSREVIVAVFLSDQTLQGVREIQVIAANNARAVRR